MNSDSQTPRCKTALASEMLEIESRIPERKKNAPNGSPAPDQKQNEGINKEYLKNKDFRRLLANQTVTSWAKWASMAGFIPLPALDIMAIASLQTFMIKELCQVYGIAFKKEIVSSVVASLVTSGVSTIVSGKLVSSVLHPIAFVGSTLGAITLPAISYATTYALGEVFIKHFEANGSIDDLEVETYDNFFKQKIAQAKESFTKRTAFSSN